MGIADAAKCEMEKEGGGDWKHQLKLSSLPPPLRRLLLLLQFLFRSYEGRRRRPAGERGEKHNLFSYGGETEKCWKFLSFCDVRHDLSRTQTR